MFSGYCIMRHASEYAAFLSGLKDGDKVGVQVFHPRGDSLMDEKHQYWKIYEGEWRTGQVRYDGNSHPIRSDGLFRYRSSEKPYGDVFPSRIVQWSHEFAPRFEKADRIYYSDGYIKSDRPVYEPLWSRQSFFLDKYGPDNRSVQRSLNAEKYPGILTHSWEVNDGTIIQVFDQGDHEFSKVPVYLYSEDCPD